METKQSISKFIFEKFYANIPRVMDKVEAFDSDWIYYSGKRKLPVEGRNNVVQIGDIVVSVLTNLSIVDGAFILSVIHMPFDNENLILKHGDVTDLLRVENVRIEIEHFAEETEL